MKDYKRKVALQFYCVLLACFLTTSCTTVFDKAHGYRGPIVVTIETEDGSVPEFPFLIESVYTESCGHSSCGIDSGYRYFKTAYANEPITFPRERLDLLQPNAYATILLRLLILIITTMYLREALRPPMPMTPSIVHLPLSRLLNK
ncbi:hypothetical protein P4S63_18975 [Pseudoalteromonas sp. B193]